MADNKIGEAPEIGVPVNNTLEDFQIDPLVEKTLSKSGDRTNEYYAGKEEDLETEEKDNEESAS